MSQNNCGAPMPGILGEEIRKVAPTTVLVRIFPVRRGFTYLFERDFYRTSLDHRIEEGVARLVRRAFGNLADWRVAHDFYLPTGDLYLTPEPHQKGYIPEDDQSFGLAPARRIEISGGNIE
ncbi:hypothetical protein [Streptomyces goshikiensis]|uniref:hypothetical protein n=1 Tax=Streptomyces goshikiensis TaxID=1942 RepID=UPI003646381A